MVGTLPLDSFTLKRIAVHITSSSIVIMCLHKQTQSPVSHTGSPEPVHILLEKIYFRVQRRELYFTHSHYPFSHCLTKEGNNLHTTYPLKIRLLTQPQHPTMNEDLRHLNHVHLS